MGSQAVATKAEAGSSGPVMPVEIMTERATESSGRYGRWLDAMVSRRDIRLDCSRNDSEFCPLGVSKLEFALARGGALGDSFNKRGRSGGSSFVSDSGESLSLLRIGYHNGDSNGDHD